MKTRPTYLAAHLTIVLALSVGGSARADGGTGQSGLASLLSSTLSRAVGNSGGRSGDVLFDTTTGAIASNMGTLDALAKTLKSARGSAPTKSSASDSSANDGARRLRAANEAFNRAKHDGELAKLALGSDVHQMVSKTRKIDLDGGTYFVNFKLVRFADEHPKGPPSVDPILKFLPLSQRRLANRRVSEGNTSQVFAVFVANVILAYARAKRKLPKTNSGGTHDGHRNRVQKALHSAKTVLANTSAILLKGKGHPTNVNRFATGRFARWRTRWSALDDASACVSFSTAKGTAGGRSKAQKGGAWFRQTGYGNTATAAAGF
jgi:hypothetical protein